MIAAAAATLALWAGGDQTPPTVLIEGLETCILSHTCFLYVESSEDAALVGTGRVRVSGGRSFRFKRISRPVRAREEYELSFALRRPARRVVARALRHGRRVTAREKVVVTDRDGNRRVRRRSVPVVLE